MKIKIKNPQEIRLKRGKLVLILFFSDKNFEIKNLKIKKEISKFSKQIKNIKENQSKLFFSEEIDFLFLNLGEKKKWTQRKFLLNLRKPLILIKENNFKEAVFFIDEIIPSKSNIINLAQQISENILLADYKFVFYKEKPKQGWPKIDLIEIASLKLLKYQKQLNQGLIIGKAVNFVRDLSNTPGGDMTPQKLANVAKTIAKKNKKIKIEIFDNHQLKKLGMEGILGVAQGSIEKPKLIILKYFGKSKDKKIDLAFIGKGITFDTGGLDIKPFEAMKEMYMDMSGGAAVLGAISGISQIKTPLNIICLIPAVENMPSGHALRPGDILKSYNGKTIEVLSTDAEGRIILADAISYAVKNYKPKAIVDIATLTGAALVALGYRAIALFTNMSDKEKVLVQIGEDSGDYAWPLPCWEEYEEEIKGKFGDIANLGKYSGYGGAITAAMFLKYFTEESFWVHLDISPTISSIENQGLTKGATGSGTRYLIKLAQDFNKLF